MSDPSLDGARSPRDEEPATSLARPLAPFWARVALHGGAGVVVCQVVAGAPPAEAGATSVAVGAVVLPAAVALVAELAEPRARWRRVLPPIGGQVVLLLVAIGLVVAVGHAAAVPSVVGALAVPAILQARRRDPSPILSFGAAILAVGASLLLLCLLVLASWSVSLTNEVGVVLFGTVIGWTLAVPHEIGRAIGVTGHRVRVRAALARAPSTDEPSAPFWARVAVYTFLGFGVAMPAFQAAGTAEGTWVVVVALVVLVSLIAELAGRREGLRGTRRARRIALAAPLAAGLALAIVTDEVRTSTSRAVFGSLLLTWTLALPHEVGRELGRRPAPR